MRGNILRFFAPDTIHTLLQRNRSWAQRISAVRPTLFPSLANSQHPQILWIGCSDSRVPETSVLDLLPGDVFVHRNIANVLPANDLSSLSVLQYAVEVLEVRQSLLSLFSTLKNSFSFCELWMWIESVLRVDGVMRSYIGSTYHYLWTLRLRRCPCCHGQLEAGLD